jgi:hypothetical protein
MKRYRLNCYVVVTNKLIKQTSTRKSSLEPPFWASCRLANFSTNSLALTSIVLNNHSVLDINAVVISSTNMEFLQTDNPTHNSF